MNDSLLTAAPAAPHSQLADLAALAVQLRRQAAQADQVIAAAMQAYPNSAPLPDSPEQAALGASWTDIHLPPQPPAAWAHLLRDWPRQGLALALLGQTGWALRYGLSHALAARFGYGSSRMDQAYRDLAAAGLCETAKFHTGRPPKSRGCVVIRLKPAGVALLRAIGLEPAPSEWTLLTPRLSTTAIAGAVTLAHHARRLGYTVAVGTDAVQPVHLTLDGETTWVAALDEERTLPARRILWLDQLARQAGIAFWAPTPEARQAFVQEARTLSQAVRATDPQTLTEEAESLWAAV